MRLQILNTYAFLFLFFLSALKSSASTVERRLFDHYNTEDGLVSNRVYDLVQDNEGFLWIATDFGAERFDGTKFSHFNLKKYPNMHRRDIHALEVSDRGVLMGSASGVCIEYISKLDSFVDLRPTSFDSTSYKQITSFCTDPEGNRYITTVGGIFKYDEKLERYTSDVPINYATRNTYVMSMYIDKKGRFWLGGLGELLIYSKVGKLLVRLSAADGIEGIIPKMIEMPNGEILVITMAKEQMLCKFTGNGFEHRKVSTPIACIYDVILASDGYLYYGTDGTGLWRSDSNFEKFVRIRPYGEEDYQMHKIYAVYEDRDKNIWLATQNSGVFRLRKKGQGGVIFSRQYGIPDFTCSAFMNDNEGNIYMTGDGKGLLKMNADLSDVQINPLVNNNVLSVSKDRSGMLRLSTWGNGTILYDTKTGKYFEEEFKGMENAPRCFFSTMQTSDGRTYYLSAGTGVIVRDDATGLCKREVYEAEGYKWTDLWALKAIEGKGSVFWIITTNTIWRTEKGDTIPVLPNVSDEKTYTPLSFTDGALDEEGNLYVSTSRGVLRITADGRQYEYLDFLPKGEYMSITRTQDGLFFAARLGGVVYFDYENKSYREMPGYFEDQAKSYFYARAIMENDGKLYVGTNTGFYIIDYNHLTEARATEMCRLGNLYLGGEKVKPYTDGVLKGGMLSEIEELVLPSELANNVEMDVEVIDFSAGVKPVVSYRLSPKDKWVEVTSNRKLTFTYLPEGLHKLEVKITKPGTKTQDCMLSLSVRVLPPWWRSGVAILSWVLLGLLAFYAVYRYRLMRFTKQKRQLEEKVEERTAELRIALDDKDRLISVVAHDLKNPMFGIVGALEDEKDKNPKFSAIYNQAVSLQNEMVDLVNWAKEKRETLQATLSLTDLETIIRRELYLLSSATQAKEISVGCVVELKHYAYTDCRMFGTMVRNLVNNAVKFTERGGSICVSAIEKENYIEVSVADTGIGMTEEKVKELQTKDDYQHTLGTEKEMSTGLGLNIVKDYASKLGTCISIKSELGKGTCISFTVKASKDEVKREEKDVETVNVAAEQLDEMKLVVVDDDELIRENLGAYLSQYYNVLLAENGAEAYELVEKEKPDMVISDVQMPLMNGIDLCKKMYESDKYRHIPLLFMSANSDETDRILGLSAGAVDYISKPFERKELLLKISNSFKVRRMLQEKLVGLKVKGEKVKEEEINPFIAEIFKVIEENYSDSDLTVDKIASELAISTATLNRRTRSLSGKTPIEMLTEYRMNKAMTMLKSGKNSVTDVAYAVGFSDPAYFSRKFKEFFGESPSKVL